MERKNKRVLTEERIMFEKRLFTFTRATRAGAFVVYDNNSFFPFAYTLNDIVDFRRMGVELTYVQQNYFSLN